MCEWTLLKNTLFWEVLPAFLGGHREVCHYVPILVTIFFLLSRDGYYKLWDSTSKICILLSLKGFFDPKPRSHGSSKWRMLSFFHVFLLFLLPSSEFWGENNMMPPPKKMTQPPPLNLHQEARTNAGIPLRLEACKEFSFIAMLACNTPNNILSMCISEVSCTWLMIGCGCFWKKTAVNGYA